MKYTPSRTFYLVAALLGLAAAAAAADPARARITLHLPADAVLTVEGQPTGQTGPRRVFDTPPLAPGKTFAYTLRATWTESGRPVTFEREVSLQAGVNMAIDLVTEQRAAAARNTAAGAAAARPAATKERDFQFTYAATVTGLQPGQTARIWLPVAASNDHQEVQITSELPAGTKVGTEAKYGNRVLYYEGKAGADGTVPVSVTYQVKRREVTAEQQPRPEDRDEAAKFLQADSVVPVGGRSLKLLEGKVMPADDQLLLGRMMYDAVNDYMRYSKEGTGWGRGDVDWACDSKYGNCTDFHSLFISMARAYKMPAKFEIGFPIPEKRGTGDVAGYHCWAFFQPQGRGWFPVDISEANKLRTKRPEMVDYYFGHLTEDRITFTTGRDLTLTPPQDGPPLNFFIYPYVEVDGKPYDKVTKKFAYQDVNGKG